MSHEIESMIYRGDTPWHKLGTPINGVVEFATAFAMAGLDWNVNGVPLYIRGTDGRPSEYKGSQALVRSTDYQQLGIVSEGYSILQNVDAFQPIFEALIKTGKVEIETAGSLRGGKRVFMLARLLQAEADILKGDAVKGYLLAATSHDGTQAHVAQFTTTRVVCANTLQTALNSAGEARIRTRHRGDVAQTVKDIATLIDTATQSFQASVEQYQSLARKAVSIKDLEAYVRLVFELPMPKPSEEPTRSKLIPTIDENALVGIGMDIPGVRGTAWAAYNAVTQYLTHEKGKSADNRLDSGAFGVNAQLNKRALEYALAL